jgi:amino acid permease
MLAGFQHHLTTTERGVLGTVTSLGSAALSLTNLEAQLRIMGLVIGIFVGLATLISVWLDIKKKRNNK